jgi:hypothetical protein
MRMYLSLREVLSLSIMFTSASQGLKPIEKRPIHSDLATFLKAAGYQGYVSIEMGRQDELQVIESACSYVKEIFG